MKSFFASVDWRTALMLGPRHEFTPAQWKQMAPLLAISPTIKVSALLNALFLSFILVQSLPPGVAVPAFLIFLSVALLMLSMAAMVWRRPTMKRLYIAYGATTVPVGFVGGFAMAILESKGMGAVAHEVLMRGLGLGLLFAFGIWVVAMWRNEFLADWLHDEELRAHAAEASRKLSSAQIQPHFLFNSLASLQHWVASKDDRAAPLLASLTHYLRATLPLFDRPLLAVGEEAEAARRYLEVMQARLGERLRYALDIDPAAAAVQLPPGVLLTLVENAVEHGVQPSLSGGEVRVQARLLPDGALLLEVLDDGPGLAPLATVTEGSLGLHNSRLRLQQAFGGRAALKLGNRAEGGCCAVVQLGAHGGDPIK
ncbi:histidine kinase [Pelomonas sp. SE-A7]|uniref:sensor histidine kinase n=1 Tax=Pelomonas sp. SE-A7 TaxID=3054953 RepID=UPI00259CD921|nr:histidine kinase [Pelomonas sp. SE-A7]MDM4766981.1 histidine kinase [Pelomonas sp. SE-A7]